MKEQIVKSGLSKANKSIFIFHVSKCSSIQKPKKVNEGGNALMNVILSNGLRD